MKSAVLQKAENKNQSMITSSSKRNEDASLIEGYDMPFEITKGPAFDFGKINVHDSKNPIRVQPKIKINEPDIHT